MFFSPLSQRCVLLRALRASGVTAAGSRAPQSARCCGGLPGHTPGHTPGHIPGHIPGLHAERRSLSVLKSVCLQRRVPGPPARCLSSSGQASPEQLIYTGSLGTAVRGVKMFSYSTSGASIILMPQILLNTGLGTQSWAMQAAFCGVIGFFTFLTPIMLHLITKGYVVRLYHEPTQDVYTAVTYSMFLTEKRTVFHQTKVRLPDVSRMFTTFYADRMGLLVNPDLFTVPQHYNHLMGYDKPFTFCPEQLDKS